MQIQSAEYQTVNLNGLHGEFYIQGCNIIVHYFSTFATPNSTGAGHHQLLEQLNPMRERVKASSMENLDSLLQRDLSDERIASDLIPYLEGRFSKVGFFPPILAVLMPRQFIGRRGRDQLEYPRVNKESSSHWAYGDCWKIQFFPEKDADGNERPSRLAQLQIVSQNSDIIVLDGQHRSNAFRFAAGQFSPSDIYKPFYHLVKPLKNYTSDLPVTVIWFERAKEQVEIAPTDISRELFVAVNNTAKRVSESRTILLDEINVTSLAVNTIYQHLARHRGFEKEALNLLTGAFDLDSSLSSSKQPRMAITNPVILEYALTYAFFGNAGYDNLKERATRAAQTNEDRFRRIFSGKVPYETQDRGRFRILDIAKRDDFRKVFIEKYFPVIDALFRSHSLVGHHEKAIAHVSKWVADQPEGAYQDVWEKIFVGGEGLYSAFMTSRLDACKKHKKYMKEINDEFMRVRSIEVKKTIKKPGDSILNRIAQSFESINTIAFQTAFLMSIDYLFRNFFKANEWTALVKEVERMLGEVSSEAWLIFYNEFRERFIGSVDPNSWPGFQLMLLRIWNEDYVTFDEEENLADFPEVKMSYAATETAIKYLLESEGQCPDDERIAEIADREVKKSFDVIEGMMLKTPNKKKVMQIVRKHGFAVASEFRD